MRYLRIMEAVYAKPWAITPDGHEKICALLESKIAQHAAKPGSGLVAKPESKDRIGINWLTGALEVLPSMRIETGTAYIPVFGVLARDVSLIERSCGVTDYDDIAVDIKEALESAEAERIALVINSPGGMVAGCEECAFDISEATRIKPVVAFTPELMASAAIQLALGATAICAAPSSLVGSIGVIWKHIDESKAWEMAGYKAEVFKSDELKATGTAGTSFTERQKTYLQGLVDEMAGKFKATVRRQRDISDDSVLDGRVFTAETAMKAGLIDRVVNTRQAAAAVVS